MEEGGWETGKIKRRWSGREEAVKKQIGTVNVCFSVVLRDDPVATAELNEFVLSRVCEQITPHRTSPNLVSDLPISLHITFKL